MNIFGESFDALDRVFNFFPNVSSWRKRGIPKPVMANHPFFCWVCDRSRFQFQHRPKRLVDLRLHFLEKIVREFHPADIERKTKITVIQKI